MNTYNIVFAIFILGMIIGVGGLFAGISISFNNKATAYDNARIWLDKSFVIANGRMSSPTIIEITNNPDTFLTFAQSINATKIYEITNVPEGFIAIANSTYALEYQPTYAVHFWYIWG